MKNFRAVYIFSLTSLCVCAYAADHASNVPQAVRDFEYQEKVAKDKRAEKDQLKTTQGECLFQLKHTMREFEQLEYSVANKIVDPDNRQKLLPWTSSKPWKNIKDAVGGGEQGSVERDTIGQSSAAMVKITERVVTEHTPYTRFEDFKILPDINHGVEGHWTDFRLKESLEEICSGGEVYAGVQDSRHHTNDMYRGYFKYDIVAQAKLFESYAKEARQAAIKYGQLEKFKYELDQIDNRVASLKAWVLEKRAAKLL